MEPTIMGGILVGGSTSAMAFRLEGYHQGGRLQKSPFPTAHQPKGVEGGGEGWGGGVVIRSKI